VSGILGLFTGGGGAAAANYIEDVFSTYLYSGTGATQTINNGIDLAGKGGLVWAKSRTSTNNNGLYDSARGFQNVLNSAREIAQQNYGSSTISSVSSTGFSIGSDIDINSSGNDFVSWTFRKQPKFFDIVTYTGTGANRTISHNLGSVPGCIIVKRTDTGADWQVYHRSLANTQYIVLNSTAAVATGATRWNSTTPTSAVFSLGTDSSVNDSGGTYVAYLFAHNAGGFGLTGADNVISCGSLVASGSTTVNLGYEPQWILTKDITDAGQAWVIQDVMRGMPNQLYVGVGLQPNSSAAEVAANIAGLNVLLTSTGFVTDTSSQIPGSTYIYIAIRRGPMKVPTVGTSVFSPIAATGLSGTKLTTNFAVDSQITAIRIGSGVNSVVNDRLRRVSTSSAVGTPYLVTTTTAAESSSFNTTQFWDNTGFQIPGIYGGTNSIIYWNFRRAPGFFDVVCYTGDGSLGRNISHSLKVTPEIIFAKRRDSSQNWIVNLGTTLSTNINLFLNTTDANVQSSFGVAVRFSTADTFHVAGSTTYDTNISGATYVAYLFATCPGVSKVGSYTGTGATQTIDCGFASGARFVLVKRTDSTGDWYVWDTARGMVSGTDPSLLLNSSAAEVNANSVYTTGVGFQIVSTAAGINASGGSYIYLAIA
jgi:hypothetical protein